MNKADTLKRLEELFNAPEATNGFPSQGECIAWANKAAPLLKFNDQYYQVFMYHSQVINRNISIYTAEPAFRTMLSQVQMAIEELKLDIANSEESEDKKNEPSAKTNLVDIKPNFYGIGINLNEAWRRFKNWFK